VSTNVVDLIPPDSEQADFVAAKTGYSMEQSVSADEAVAQP
jgi:hypothetical protein